MNDQKERGKLFNGVIKVWRGLDLVRKIILNVVFFLILFYVLSWWMADDRPEVPGSAVLVLSPQGSVVDQLRWPTFDDAVDKMMGMAGAETLLKDLLDAVDAAKDDDRIKALVLNLNGLGGAGLTKLQDLGEAIKQFKRSGKKVIAVADAYSRNSYYLAAHADEIFMHPMGMVILEGYGRYRRYYKDLIDRLEVDVHIFRVGKYKSAVEPYMRDGMSDPAKEANIRWLGALWNSYLQDVAAARKIKAETLTAYADQLNRHLKDNEGDAALAAKKAGLIDVIATRDQVRERLIKITGENKDTHSYYRIGYKSYLAALAKDRWGTSQSGDVVGVVVAKGSILDGYRNPGAIGGESTAKLLRKARQNKKVKAIVLKVDSGGGSAFASEVIRREMELARKDGKPVVISMGAVAASGGYWISMASDEVWAYPTTITGSIGIFGMFPTYQRTLSKFLGVHVDGVGTNKLAGALRTDRKLAPEIGEAIQAIIDQGYDRFITMVAKARNKTPEQIDEIAQGRVWIGEDAHKLGLVDKLGTFHQALDSAAKLAKLDENYNIRYFRQYPTFNQRMMIRFFSKASARAEETGSTGKTGNRAMNPFTNVMKIMIEQVRCLSQFNDPNGMYAYWSEEVNF
jgi:protease-4